MQYKAIFFDWDGTAVKSRKEPVDSVVELMKKLLSKDVKMIIISGTTYDKIADGKLHEYFTKQELGNLYLGLGRGAHNYSFKEKEEYLQSQIKEVESWDKKNRSLIKQIGSLVSS